MSEAFASGRYACTTCGAVFRGDIGHCPRDGTPLQSTLHDPLEGRRLGGGRYAIIRFIGEGSAGRVYEAEDLRDVRRCAVKVLFGELAAVPEILHRFRREATAAARLRHRNIASVLDSGLQARDEPIFLVMELVRGRTLYDIVAQQGPLPVAKARRVLDGVVDGLAHAHAQAILHRDLKPDNIILEHGTGHPRLVDFGVSKLLATHAEPRLTSYGRVVGTPGFIAPEVLRGATPDLRSDLYSLGVTAFFALTGRYPFKVGETTTIADTLAGIDTSALNTPGIDPDLRRWIDALVAMSPQQRPATAQEALSFLRTGDISIPPQSGSGGPPPRLSTQHGDWFQPDGTAPSTSGLAAERRSRPILALAGVVGLLVLGLAAGAVLRALTAQAPSPIAADGRAAVPRRSPAVDPVAPPQTVDAPPVDAVFDDALPVDAAFVDAPPVDAPPVPPRSVPPLPGREPTSHGPGRSRGSARARPLSRDGAAAGGARGAPAPRAAPASPEPSRRARATGVADASAALEPAPTAQVLLRAYEALGERLDRLSDRPEVETFRQRYFDIPIADALRRPALVPSVLTRVRRLDAEVDAASQ